MADFVRVEIRDAIGTIRLERPPMNALNRQVQDEIRDAATAVSTDDGVRAIIVYGGEKVFAAGADIKEMADMSYVDMAARAADLSDALGALARIPKPVVAAITGYALGGGCEIALACDWRVVAEDAKLGQPEIKLGIIPGAGGTQRLARLVGPARAKDIILSGRMVDAQEALRIGLADRVVPAAAGVRRGRRAGHPVHQRAGPGRARGEAGHRRRPGDGPDLRPRVGEPALRGPVRHRGPARGHGGVRGEAQARLQGTIGATQPDVRLPVCPEPRRSVSTSARRTPSRWSARPDGRVRPLLFDGSPLLPSAVYAEPDGALVVGRDAVHSARLDPARFEPNPKRRIDDGSVLLGDREVPVADLVAAVLARVAEEWRRAYGDASPRLTLTCPAAWGATRRGLLADAADRAGLGAGRLVAEPVAAATYFAEVLGRDVPIGAAVVVYDFGAGTFDASVVVRRAAGFEVVAVDGRADIGGLDVDAALVAHLAQTVRAARPGGVAAARHPGDGRGPPGQAAAVGRRTGGQGAAVRAARRRTWWCRCSTSTCT